MESTFGWISVNDAMPKENERVMVWYKNWIEPDVKYMKNSFYRGWIAHDGGMDSSELESEHVHFWHKWPEAPLWLKEKKQNNNQRLKAEILPLLTDALEEFADRKFEHGKHYLEQAITKLSAVAENVVGNRHF